MIGIRVMRIATGEDVERVALLPAGDNLKTGLHIGSEEARAFWLDHLEELNERFNTWSGTSE